MGRLLELIITQRQLRNDGSEQGFIYGGLPFKRRAVLLGEP